jgi:hypothetical protein
MVSVLLAVSGCGGVSLWSRLSRGSARDWRLSATKCGMGLCANATPQSSG